MKRRIIGIQTSTSAGLGRETIEEWMQKYLSRYFKDKAYEDQENRVKHSLDQEEIAREIELEVQELQRATPLAIMVT